jgi:CheY-like chemotaxis protein
MHILLVEDEPITRELVTAILEKEGMTVTSTSTGESAVDLLMHELRPDVLITDIQMPGAFNGWSVARLYQDQDPTLPVIYLSAGSGEREEVDNSLYLRKPVTPQALLEAVRRQARSSGAHRPRSSRSR